MKKIGSPADLSNIGLLYIDRVFRRIDNSEEWAYISPEPAVVVPEHY